MKRFLLLLMLIALPGVAPAQTGLILLDDAPAPQPATPVPPSLGQQPFPIYKEPDLTPSQSNSNQLNQLFLIENTPDTGAAGEGYVSGDFEFLRLTDSTYQYHIALQGQYSFTDQIAAGAFVPTDITKLELTRKVKKAKVMFYQTKSGPGDIGFYAQYKLDQVINPEIFNLTAQLDVIVPTGNAVEMRDSGRFGVRPLILAYKDFGQHGPGSLGLYGLLGATLTTKSDVRLGIAATYQYRDLVGICELFDYVNNRGRSMAQVTPGVCFRGISPWEISLGVPLGISQGTPDWSLICKLTYVFQN